MQKGSRECKPFLNIANNFRREFLSYEEQACHTKPSTTLSATSDMLAK